jgi:hypothetical protein
MKGLEGWARGLPVAASREAADQLGATDGEDILVADTTEQFARAIVLLAERPELGQSLAEGAQPHAGTAFRATGGHRPAARCLRDRGEGFPPPGRIGRRLNNTAKYRA